MKSKRKRKLTNKKCKSSDRWVTHDCYGIGLDNEVGKTTVIKINGVDFPIEEWYD